MRYIDQFGQTGVVGVDREHLSDEVYDVAVARDGCIIVVDSVNCRVIRLSEDLKYIDQFGQTAAWFTDRERVQYPTAVAVGPDGSIYVLASDDRRVIRLTEDLEYIDQFGQNGVSAQDRQHLSGSAYGLHVLGNGDVLVADSSYHRLLQLSEDLKYLAQFGETNVSALDRQHLWMPCGVAQAKDGSILIADRGNARIVRLSEDLKYIDAYRVPAVSAGVHGIDVMADGSIIVSSEDRRTLVRYSEDFRYLDQFGETGVAGADRQHLSDTKGVAVAKDGSILVADMGNNRVIRLTED